VPTDVVIPKLGMTMKEGTIVEWAVPDGGRVEPDDVVFVLSTDKLDTEVTAETAGTLRHLAAAGECHPCSTVVGRILADGESAVPVAQNGDGETPPRRERRVATPYARRLARERGVELEAVAGTGPGGRIVAADVERIKMTPVARRVADQRGVDVTAISGTGPAGRITKEDVEAAAAVDHGPASIPLRGMRSVIAERMHASLSEMAQLTLGMDVDMTEVVELRRGLLEAWAPRGVRISITDLVCRAAVLALADHPGLNASVDGDVIVLHPDVHLGVAVAVPDGLLVPVVNGADRRSLAELSTEVGRLAGACRDGTIGVDRLEGATFTVTALGASGIDFFTPIINPPNVAILGVGRLRDGVAWDGDRPIRRDVITLSLTIDHRAVDGAPGAAYLGTVRDLLASPLGLLR
jgi:pyruvate/2-oxoglutarate dehydrogenase complex dihydrolipoamide acyltransferase (E2) component